MNKVTLGGFTTSQIFFPFQIFIFVAAVATIISIQSNVETRKTHVLHMAVSADLLPHFVLGYRLLAADVLWVRTIQEMDYRESVKMNKGWVFQMLDGVTNLDPRFYMVYVLGTVDLSVIVDDVEGARLIFEKGVANYPKDWLVLYRAAYHYLYEVKNCKRAAELFNRAAINGAPPWLSTLASHLYNQAGQYEIAKSVLIDALKRFGKEKDYGIRIRERLDQLEEAHKTGKSNFFAKCEDPGVVGSAAKETENPK